MFRSLFRISVMAFALLPAGCDDGLGVATVKGTLGREGGQSNKAFATGKVLRSADSTETSLTGLSLELVLFTEEVEGEGMVEQGVEATIVPNPDGSFEFSSITARTPWPPDPSMYEVRIKQDETAVIPYGSGGPLWVDENEVLQLSLPVVTRLTLPMWASFLQDTDDPRAAPISVCAHDTNGKVVYFNPVRGLGIYDAAGTTVDVLLLENVLIGWKLWSVPHVVEEEGLIVLEMIDIEQESRIVIVDMSIFSDDTASELLDYSDPVVQAELGDSVTVIELTGEDNTTDHAWDWGRYESSPRTHPTYVASTGHYYLPGSLGYIELDLVSKTHVATDNSNYRLIAHNPQSDLLFFYSPEDESIRVDKAADGSVAATHTLGMVGQVQMRSIVPWKNDPRTLLVYIKEGSARVRVFDESGEAELDELADAYFNYTEGWLSSEFDWQNCHEGSGPIDDFGNVAAYMFFDTTGEYLLVGPDQPFAVREDGFVPMPHRLCGHFDTPEECGGMEFVDPVTMVTVMRPEGVDGSACLLYNDARNLTTTVELDGQTTTYQFPAILSSMGMIFIPTSEGMTVLHFANPNAAGEPALRDLTGEVTVD